MSYDEEDDFSSSSREALDSPAKAKREALKRKLEKQGQKREADNPTADLKSLKLAMLKGQMAGQKDEQTKRDRLNQQKSSFNFGTKTREQQIAAQKSTTDAKPNQDQMLDQNKQDEKAKEEQRKEEVTGED